MNKELIKENIEDVKFKNWQKQVRIWVQEATGNALVRINMLWEETKNEQ